MNRILADESDDLHEVYNAKSRDEFRANSKSFANILQSNKSEDLDVDESDSVGDDVDVDNEDIMLIEQDVRKELFHHIPDPYPHPQDYQRVHISETDDFVDQDNISASNYLKVCLFLLKKNTLFILEKFFFNRNQC